MKSGRLDSAIADYDEALRVDPKNAYTLYGRGLAKQMNGDPAGGAADIAAAKAIDADIADKFNRLGVSRYDDVDGGGVLLGGEEGALDRRRLGVGAESVAGDAAGGGGCGRAAGRWRACAGRLDADGRVAERCTDFAISFSSPWFA